MSSPARGLQQVQPLSCIWVAVWCQRGTAEHQRELGGFLAVASGCQPAEESGEGWKEASKRGRCSGMV